MSRFTLFKQIPRSDFFFVAVLSLLCFGLFFIDNELRPSNDEDSERVKVEILEVDNSNLEQSGIIQTGIQDLELEILSGTFRGKRLHSENQLMGRLEFDKIFVEGDKALAVLTLSPSHDEIRLIHVIDHYRLNTELILVLLFAGFLIYYARWVGIKSILSFLFTGLVIWKILLPGFLLGYHPVLLSIGVVCVLTCVIVFLVAGWNRKGFVAFSGAMTGVLLTCFMALFFDVFFQVHGAVKPFSETLLYSGYSNLNLTDIFLAGIFISSSGAVMDIAMDIAASQHEVLLQNPEISRKKLVRSGFAVGRAVVGTMTTTLLLAYSGGFSTLLMVFIAQGTPAINILNLNYIAGEILHTMVGSFGLVLVAPITAFIGGWMYTKKSIE